MVRRGTKRALEIIVVLCLGIWPALLAMSVLPFTLFAPGPWLLRGLAIPFVLLVSAGGGIAFARARARRGAPITRRTRGLVQLGLLVLALAVVLGSSRLMDAHLRRSFWRVLGDSRQVFLAVTSYSLTVVTPDGHTIRRVHNPEWPGMDKYLWGVAAAPDWHPEGTALLFTRREQKLVRIDVVEGEIEDLGPVKDVFYEDDGAFYARQFAGGPPVKLFRVCGPDEEPNASAGDASLLAYAYADKFSDSSALWIKAQNVGAGRIVVQGYVVGVALMPDKSHASRRGPEGVGAP